jgi:tetratricopeptide (TPR) repeat protein
MLIFVRKGFFRTEKELPLILGSIFKIQSITKSATFSTVKLSLWNENDHQLKELTNYLKIQLLNKLHFYILGDLLDDMSEYDRAERCFHRGLHRLNDQNSKEAGNCYTHLGNAYEEKMYLSPILKVCAFEKRLHDIESIGAASVIYNFGIVFENQQKYNDALVYYNRSLEIYEITLPPYQTRTTKLCKIGSI